MKNLHFGAVLMALVFSTQTLADVIGTVNVQKVLMTVKEGDSVRDKLKGQYESKKGEIKKLEDKIKKGQEDYRKEREKFGKESSVLTQAKREEREASLQKSEMELQKNITEIQNKSGQYQKEIADMENELKQPILEKIQEVIKTVSKAEGVQLTFETSTTPILYSENSKELTDEVIKAYDKKYPAAKK